jgi:hypothetical protein
MYHLDEELDAVLAFQALVGQRRHGHFDHDAHGVTGTGATPARKSFVAKSSTTSGKAAVSIKIKRDKKTGAILME